MALNDDDYASLPAKILEQARRCSLSIQPFFKSVSKLLFITLGTQAGT